MRQQMFVGPCEFPPSADFDPLVVPPPIESTIAKSANDKVDIVTLKVLFELPFQAVKAGKIDIAILSFGICLALHPYKGHCLDFFTLYFGFSGIDHGVIDLTLIGDRSPHHYSSIATILKSIAHPGHEN